MKKLVDITHEVHQELERLARYFVACLFEDPFFQQRGCILHRIEYVDELLTVPATHAGEEAGLWWVVVQRVDKVHVRRPRQLAPVLVSPCGDRRQMTFG